MKLFDNIYDFIAKKWAKIFALVGFAAYALALVFEFIGGFVQTSDGALGYIVLFAIQALVLAGLVCGYFFKKEKLLLVSFVAFLTLAVYSIVGGRAQVVAGLYVDQGSDVVYGIFGIVFAVVVACYVALLVLDYVFDFRKLNFLVHLIYLLIFPAGLLYWIMGIVYAAAGTSQTWTNAIVPLFTCLMFLFVPPVLELGNDQEPAPAPKAEPEPAPAPQEVEPEVEPEAEPKPAPKKAPSKKTTK